MLPYSVLILNEMSIDLGFHKEQELADAESKLWTSRIMQHTNH